MVERRDTPHSRIRNIEEGIRALTEQLHQSDSFTETISQWANTPVTYTSLRHARCTVGPEHAARLEIPSGSEILKRHGHFEVGPLGARRQVADVRAVVVADRLSTAARHSLESRRIPLGVILNGEGTRRHTRRITRVHALDANGRQILRVSAVVAVRGVPVAVVDEIVYRQLLEWTPELAGS